MKAIEIRYFALPAAFNCPNEALPVSSCAMKAFWCSTCPRCQWPFWQQCRSSIFSVVWFVKKMLIGWRALCGNSCENCEFSVPPSLERKGHPHSSFPWPNVQCWRILVSCDVRLIHVTVWDHGFSLETRRSSIWVAATRSQQTPGSSWGKPGG